jgi:hypothetical protein
MLGFSHDWVRNFEHFYNLVVKFDNFNIKVEKDPSDKQRESGNFLLYISSFYTRFRVNRWVLILPSTQNSLCVDDFLYYLFWLS